MVTGAGEAACAREAVTGRVTQRLHSSTPPLMKPQYLHFCKLQKDSEWLSSPKCAYLLEAPACGSFLGHVVASLQAVLQHRPWCVQEMFSCCTEGHELVGKYGR